MSMSFNRLRPVLLVVAALGLVVGAGGVWVWAQPAVKTATVGKFDAVGANPNYVVVNAPTQVLFTAKITDRQLKKRSVILLRTDAAGTPTDILGRLHDDGKNGDLRANDNTYSFRQTLKESAVGAANFRIAARFKSGRWTEPESDDDDWDKELTTLGQTGRDNPAARSLLLALLKRLSSIYSRSNQIVVRIEPTEMSGLQSKELGVALRYPTGWSTSVGSTSALEISSPARVGAPPGDLTGTCSILVLSSSKPASLTLGQWRQGLHSNDSGTLLSTVQVQIAGLSGLREVSDEWARTDEVFLEKTKTEVLSFRLLCGDDMQSIGTSFFESLLSSVSIQ